MVYVWFLFWCGGMFLFWRLLFGLCVFMWLLWLLLWLCMVSIMFIVVIVNVIMIVVSISVCGSGLV